MISNPIFRKPINNQPQQPTFVVQDSWWEIGYIVMDIGKKI
jgi:hypothetical protein